MDKNPLMFMALGMTIVLLLVGCQTQQTSSDDLSLETGFRPAPDQSFSQTATEGSNSPS